MGLPEGISRDEKNGYVVININPRIRVVGGGGGRGVLPPKGCPPAPTLPTASLWLVIKWRRNRLSSPPRIFPSFTSCYFKLLETVLWKTSWRQLIVIFFIDHKTRSSSIALFSGLFQELCVSLPNCRRWTEHPCSFRPQGEKFKFFKSFIDKEEINHRTTVSECMSIKTYVTWGYESF